MIKSITIEINGKPIELSLEEAQKLRHELNALMQEPNYVPVYPHYPQPYIWPSTEPVITYWGSTTAPNYDQYNG